MESFCFSSRFSFFFLLARRWASTLSTESELLPLELDELLESESLSEEEEELLLLLLLPLESLSLEDESEDEESLEEESLELEGVLLRCFFLTGFGGRAVGRARGSSGPSGCASSPLPASDRRSFLTGGEGGRAGPSGVYSRRLLLPAPSSTSCRRGGLSSSQ